MTDLGDRLVVVLIAATGFAVLIVGWAGGLIEAEVPGVSQYVLLGLLGFAFLAVLVGIWTAFGEVD